MTEQFDFAKLEAPSPLEEPLLTIANKVWFSEYPPIAETNPYYKVYHNHVANVVAEPWPPLMWIPTKK